MGSTRFFGLGLRVGGLGGPGAAGDRCPGPFRVGWLGRPGWVVDRAEVAGLVGVPAGLEGVGDAVLHGGGDVAVDAADAG